MPDRLVASPEYKIGEFWTSRQRQADRIHEISYRACFKPQLPRYFIERLTEPGDVVYDPFMGRGTTCVEAALMGRIPYGNDLSSLSRVLVEPRINPPSIESVKSRLQEIPWHSFTTYADVDMLVFYHEDTLAQLEGLRSYFGGRQLDGADAWIRMVAVSRLTGHSGGFFSVYTMPPNQAVSLDRQRLINERLNQAPQPKDVPALILKKSRTLLSQRKPMASRTLFLTEQSHRTPQIADGEVSLTVTSPPFLDVVDYKTDNWVRNWFLGITETPDLSIYGTLDDWREFTRRTLGELCRVTRPGGYVVYEVGEIRGGEVQLNEVVVEASAGLPLRAEYVYVNAQKFTKTSNCWGVSNNAGGTNTNRIVVFRRLD